MVKCQSTNVVSIDTIISQVDNSNSNTSYAVTLYYCNEKSKVSTNNIALNPKLGCILLVYISQI